MTSDQAHDPKDVTDQDGMPPSTGLRRERCQQRCRPFSMMALIPMHRTRMEQHPSTGRWQIEAQQNHHQ